MPIEKNLAEGERWKFDAEVADDFDDMLARSIPQYDVMRGTVLDIGSRFVQPGTFVVDLGCSRGEALAGFADRFGAQVRYLGVDVSEPMLAAALERFAGWPDGYVRIERRDLRTWAPTVPASLVLSVLTLQFTPIEYRQEILAGIREALVPGGALILVEKVLGRSATLDRAMVELYHAGKLDAGYSQDEIIRKAAALEGVLVPLTARVNEQLVLDAGFRVVDCFWRWCNFAAWVAIP